jgi:hypothetical protein
MNSSPTDLLRSARWGKTYEVFGVWLEGLDASLAPGISGRLGYSAQAIRLRVMQRVAEILLSPYIREGARLFEEGSTALPHETNLQKLGPLVLKPQLRPGMRLFIRSLTRFLWLWIQAFWGLLSNRKPSQNSATLLFGAPLAFIQGAKMPAFLTFCTQGPVAPLKNPERLIIQGLAKDQLRTQEEPQISKQPLITLAQRHSSSWIEKKQFLMNHLQALSAYGMAVLECPMVALLAEDFAHHALAHYVNQGQTLENVVITNSNYAEQSLWMTDLPGRTFQMHVMWYSTNFKLFAFKHESFSEIFPPFRYMRTDHHWVWTKGQGETLKVLQPNAQVHVVGPILWYIREAPWAMDPKDINLFKIGVFDVSPVTREWEKGFGLVYNYYQTAHMMAFIDELLAAVDGLAERRGMPVSVRIKHKRDAQPIHDPVYLKHIVQLEHDQRLEVAPSDSNLFQFVSECDLVVVIPYSSPAYVAAHCGVPAVYYDPTGTLRATHDPDPLVQFVTGLADLTHALEERKENRCAS